MTATRRFVLIFPCRNEADDMRQKLCSDRTVDPFEVTAEFQKCLRRYQWRALLIGKERAIEEIDRKSTNG